MRPWTRLQHLLLILYFTAAFSILCWAFSGVTISVKYVDYYPLFSWPQQLWHNERPLLVAWSTKRKCYVDMITRPETTVTAYSCSKFRILVFGHLYQLDQDPEN